MNILSVDPERCDADDLRAAAEWLRAGRVVAFPTDTFYGFAVDPASSDAVGVLFELKGRPADAALPLVAASITQVEQLGGVWSPAMTALARAFWPGPLSLVCDAPAHFVTGVHAGRSSVAIRVPDHRVARALAEAWGGPITATSANRTNEPPAQSADLLRDLAADPSVFVIDGGATPGGLPSTIVDARGEPPRLVRAGAVAWNRVLESLKG
jgi:L-threonylcarbamoyladenylate synthase